MTNSIRALYIPFRSSSAPCQFFREFSSHSTRYLNKFISSYRSLEYSLRTLTCWDNLSARLDTSSRNLSPKYPPLDMAMVLSPISLSKRPRSIIFSVVRKSTELSTKIFESIDVFLLIIGECFAISSSVRSASSILTDSNAFIALSNLPPSWSIKKGSTLLSL